MPFKSQAQRGYMHAKHPSIAKRWEEHTPDKKLPAKVGKGEDMKKVGYGMDKGEEHEKKEVKLIGKLKGMHKGAVGKGQDGPPPMVGKKNMRPKPKAKKATAKPKPKLPAMPPMDMPPTRTPARPRPAG